MFDSLISARFLRYWSVEFWCHLLKWVKFCRAVFNKRTCQTKALEWPESNVKHSKSPPLIFRGKHFYPTFGQSATNWAVNPSERHNVGRKHASLFFWGFYHLLVNEWAHYSHTIIKPHSLRGEIFIISYTFKTIVPVVPKVGLSIFLRALNTTKLPPQQCKAVDPASTTKLQATADEKTRSFLQVFWYGFLHTAPIAVIPSEWRLNDCCFF